VQHDIGKLAQYTVDMGALIDLLDLSLRIPPWEPMHALTPDEKRNTKLVTEQFAPGVGSGEMTAHQSVSMETIGRTSATILLPNSVAAGGTR
jgi:hypothetical protein